MQCKHDMSFFSSVFDHFQGAAQALAWKKSDTKGRLESLATTASFPNKRKDMRHAIDKTPSVRAVSELHSSTESTHARRRPEQDAIVTRRPSGGGNGGGSCGLESGGGADERKGKNEMMKKMLKAGADEEYIVRFRLNRSLLERDRQPFDKEAAMHAARARLARAKTLRGGLKGADETPTELMARLHKGRCILAKRFQPMKARPVGESDDDSEIDHGSYADAGKRDCSYDTSKTEGDEDDAGLFPEPEPVRRALPRSSMVCLFCFPFVCQKYAVLWGLFVCERITEFAHLFAPLMC